MSARLFFAPLAALLLTVVSGVTAAAGMPMNEDGWHRWEVPAGGAGRNACCYRFRGGAVAQVGCRLGGGTMGNGNSVNCDVSSDSMRVYVELRELQVVGIQAFSSACPVETHAPVSELPGVTTRQSIDWLLQLAGANPAVLEAALMVISFHAESAALEALAAVLEDRDRPMAAREQALFWLIQMNSDPAYAYLEQLLGPGD